MDIRALLALEKVKAIDLAEALNVPPRLVMGWVRGEKRPRGPALRLLTLAKTKGLKFIRL